MATRILMVNPPLLLGDSFIDYPAFTLLGVVSNAAVLREAGFDVSISDAFSRPESGVVRLAGGESLIGSAMDRVLQSRAARGPDVIVTSVSSFLFPHVRTDHAADIFRRLRAAYPGARLVAADCNFSGMHYIAYDARAFLSQYPEVDTVVQYECEHRLPEILAGPAGRDGAVIQCDASEIFPDDLPMPAWDLIALNHYYAFQARINGTAAMPRTLPVTSSRGCPFACVFCTSNPGQSARIFRAHSPEYMRTLLSRYVREYGVQQIALLDSIPNFDQDRFLSILEIIKSLNLQCSFPNGLRADRLTREHLKLLKTLCREVKISAESASERVMQGLNKRLASDAVETVAGWCHDLEIPLSIHYLIGIPFENPEDANETLAHALAMRERFGATPLVQYLTPIPGSAVHERARAEGLLKDFDPGRLYSYFTREPAFDRPEFSAEKLRAMLRCFHQRLRDATVDKVIINLTYVCSNDCHFCAVGDRERKHGDAARCIAFLKHYRGMGIDSVDFDGGEPTLYPHLLKMVAAARELGYEKINITTNARRLADRSAASKFLLSGVTSVLVSLHGHTREMHERHTRADNSFSETILGIRNILELKPQRIEFGINTTLTQWNAPHLNAFIAFIRDLGADALNLQFITPHGHAGLYEDYDVHGLIEHVAGAYNRWKDTLKLTVINLPPCLLQRITGTLEPETGKYSRDMVFADSPPMNLGRYLDQRRGKRTECRACEAASACAGFYVF